MSDFFPQNSDFFFLWDFWLDFLRILIFKLQILFSQIFFSQNSDIFPQNLFLYFSSEFWLVWDYQSVALLLFRRGTRICLICSVNVFLFCVCSPLPVSKNFIGLNRARRPHNAIFVSFTDPAVPTECLEAARVNWGRVCLKEHDLENEEKVKKVFAQLETRPILILLCNVERFGFI